mmetsp:Transcript_29804/g.72013  ORF Transcript_29804/g.72013 Transcript_29804/m.72013 type:complete len:144 (-) Transcript_29804:134-565(-)
MVSPICIDLLKYRLWRCEYISCEVGFKRLVCYASPRGPPSKIRTRVLQNLTSPAPDRFDRSSALSPSPRAQHWYPHPRIDGDIPHRLDLLRNTPKIASGSSSNERIAAPTSFLANSSIVALRRSSSSVAVDHPGCCCPAAPSQ